MLTRRLIACFDIVNGTITKARRFQDNIEIAPAAELAAALYEDQVDEFIFYDILASANRRRIDLATVEAVAANVFVPLTVGGGIANLADMHDVLDAGAEKISIDSMAVRDPALVTAGSAEFGRQCMVVSMQVKDVGRSARIPSGYEVAIDGARHFTGLDAVAWARRAEELGAGEICVNSIDRDGTHTGYDLKITGAIADAVGVPVIASGGAGTPDHVAEAFLRTGASAAIVSSMLYSPRMPRLWSVDELKSELSRRGVTTRPFVAAAPMPDA